jgi:hypothetical protein
MDQVANGDDQVLIDAEKTKLRIRQQARREVAAEAQGPVPQLIMVAADQIANHHFPLREPLIVRDQVVVFRAGHIGEVYAVRGVGKTWVLLTIGLMTSTGGEALGFAAPHPRRVLYIDGEMASHDIRDRLAALSDKTGLERTHYFQFIAADWQTEYLPRLDTPEGQQVVEPFVDQADLVIIDNRSCLFDSEGEKDPTAWQPAGDYLLSLRRRGKAVLLAHHANRQGGARGISKAEDPMDLIVKLSRPEGYTSDQGARFIWEFDKCRGLYGPAAAPFIAELTPHGWALDAPGGGNVSIRQRFIDYLRVAETANALPKSANAAITAVKVKRNDGLRTWGEMLTKGEIVGDKTTGFRLGTLVVPPF